MLITVYEKAEEFLAKARTELERNEVGNNLILGIVLGLQKFPERIEKQPYLATVEDEQGLVAAACMMPPRSLVIVGERADTNAAFALLVEDLREHGWSVPGVRGSKEAAHAFARTWERLTGQAYREGMRERMFALTEVILPRPGPGRLRVATGDDLALVTRWIAAFMAEAMHGNDANLEAARRIAEERVGDGAFYLWELEDGRAVSMATRNRPTAKVVSVSMVYTPPELRGYGYASRCVAALSQLLLESGWEYCSLFTDLANPISNSIYQKIGYRPVYDFNDYVFE